MLTMTILEACEFDKQASGNFSFVESRNHVLYGNALYTLEHKTLMVQSVGTRFHDEINRLNLKLF